MNIIFVESSALLAIVLEEPRRDEALLQIQAAQRLLASRLAKIECERAIIRAELARPDIAPRISETQREMKELWAKMDFVEISREVCNSAGRICPNSPLRTLDAIHIATFWQIKRSDPDIKMLSFDKRILAALGDVDTA